MKAVIDASVIVKWFLPDPKLEPHVDQALALLEDLKAGQVIVEQPPHWLTEVAAVITRLRPEIAETAIDLLDAMELPVTDDAMSLKKASQLSRELNHHLFDTLYHALAFERGLTLITADDHYLRKASHLGQMISLADWPGAEPTRGQGSGS
ncbi:MAG TPA: type II toxin-antitoxin system VapC family toxin [Thermoanaerobaculia bacterium]|nr:type II toxin-antitoxin system VapC family toxin [Thermoanaerobaculia bacterium]